MKNRLCVISTKNPTDILLLTIEKVKLYYDDFDIVIVDSDSTDKKYFENIPEDCIVEFCKNKNWELGAWKYAFNKYNNYEVYMFLQDTLIPNSRISSLDKDYFENGCIYTCNYKARFGDGGHIDYLKNIYKDDPEIQFITEINEFDIITGAAHSFFITDNLHVNNILKLENIYEENKIVKTKIDSLLSERTCGILADRHPKRIDVTSHFHKINCRRDYI